LIAVDLSCWHYATSSSLEVKGCDVDISEVARRSGVAASAIRFYEEKGLLHSVGRHGLRRVFGQDILQRLALIALGRAAGFSLEELRRMFSPERKLRIDRQVISAKADELDAKVRTLSAMSEALRHVAACRAPSHLECPTFQRLLRAASAGLLKAAERN
jgi:DNA-binding transcriptional MerR regulator